MADIRRLPGPNAEKWEWQLFGACRGEDTDLFFHPEGERGPARANREIAAKAICARCPVIAQCAAHALATHEPYGVWGGLSESEREARIAEEERGIRPAVAMTTVDPGILDGQPAGTSVAGGMARAS